MKALLGRPLWSIVLPVVVAVVIARVVNIGLDYLLAKR